MRTFAIVLVVFVASLAFGQGAQGGQGVQGGQSAVEVAKGMVVEKMASDWVSEVVPTWGEVRSVQTGDETMVFGYGVARRQASAADAVFLFEVRMYSVRRLATRVGYEVLRWSSDGAPNDRYMTLAAQAVVRQRLEADARASLRIDFTQPKLTNASPETRLVEGGGTYSGAGGMITGSIQYSARISRTTGAIEGVVVTPLASNPGVGWGGQHNAMTERAAQAHAAEYVRAREGSSVQIQFTGPVTHMTIATGIDRVSGRGQWRRGTNFQWADFRYDIQVGIEDGKIHSAVVNLTPDIHGAAEDQKFISFAQTAVRRDFRAQSPAQPTFLSSKVTTLPFGKKSVSGEFSAGGKRYGYEVVMDAATTRTDRVTITPR